MDGGNQIMSLIPNACANVLILKNEFARGLFLLANLVSTPSEKIFIVQPGSPPKHGNNIFLCPLGT